MKPARGQFDSQRPLGRAGQGRFFVVRTRRPLRSTPDAQRSSGFTLVEMLVSTGLVVLIMLLFAQIFGSAIGTMTEQRGMANNDQKARTLSGVLRGDLQSMTYRQPAWPYGTVQGIVPLAAGDDPIIDPANQRGYFYFSENDPAIDWDDVLQFTTMIRSGQRGDAPTNNQQRVYVGKAGNLDPYIANPSPPPDFIPTPGFNEVERDDGIDEDSQGQSRAAEICYYLRNGNLYRRVLLLRDPLSSGAPKGDQPSTSAGTRLYSGSGSANYTSMPLDSSTGRPQSPAPNNTFYNDFDYSATRANDSSGTYLWFHSISSLDNHLGQSNMPIALPWHRFGFRNLATDTSDHGMPREYLDSTNVTSSNNTFFGRFTQEETSSTAFTWPGAAINALDRSTSGDSFTANGTVNAYQNGSRIGEDLLLTNVEAFDVQVQDTGSGSAGYFQLGSGGDDFGTNANDGYGPRQSNNRVFDTWHSSIGASTAIPFRPTKHAVTNATWAGLSGNASSSSVIPVPALIYDNSTPLYSNSLVYKVISPTSGSASTGGKQPEFPPVPGTIVQDGINVRWQCVDNRVGLKAIRITVRYRDVSSNLSRQVTLVHSFVE